MEKRSNNTGFKVALVHDWLLGLGGAERVLKVLHEMFPEAPIYTLFHRPQFTSDFLPQAQIIPSSLQKLYHWTNGYRWLLPFLPATVESWDLSQFELVISSSFSFAKGLILKPQTKHWCYCYSPTRWLWDRSAYNHGLAKILAHFLRIWDRQASTRVDQFIAVSQVVRRRIKKYYDSDSLVVYPPLTLTEEKYSLDAEKDFLAKHHLPPRYWLIVSRLFPHKNIEIAIAAFNKLDWPLVIVGEGPARNKLERLIANQRSIKMVGFQSDQQLPNFYAHCQAFLMPQEEDFGLTPLEAMSFGKPVLALRQGGALEYILERINGEFFAESHPAVLADGARRLRDNYQHYSPLVIKKTAEKFSRHRFENEIKEMLVRT